MPTATDKDGTQCAQAQLNAVTDLCNDPPVTDSEGHGCYQSQIQPTTDVRNDQPVTDPDRQNYHASEINPETKLCDAYTTASGDGKTCRTSRLVSGFDGYDCDYKLP